MARKVKDDVRRTTRISTKNQITIPVEALREARLGPGDRLEVTAADDGRVVLRRADSPFEEFAGALTGVYPAGHLGDLRGEWR
ncbi:MAG: AbrB/MazE/SpoVT family DNA-binding domain-containing protein [Thermoleophilia bacterium]